MGSKGVLLRTLVAASSAKTAGLECPVCTEVARSERFELPALGIEIRCSIQLSYERVLVYLFECT